MWSEIILRPLLYAALVAFVFIPLERAVPLRSRRRVEFGTDLWFASVGAIMTRGLLFLLAGVTLSLCERWGVDGPLWDVPPIVSIVGGILYFELASYAYHRLAHRVPVLWRLHEVHHSSTEMDWLAGFRQHPVEIALMTLVQNLPLVLLGMPLGSHALVVLFLQLNTLFVHSNVRTPSWLSYFVATPAFHHRHHALNGDDSNFATLFPWIDRWFGTFCPESAENFGTERYGRSGFLQLLFAPFGPRPAGHERPANATSGDLRFPAGD